MKFYNSTDGVAIRLSIRGHLPQQGLGLLYCALCGQHRTGFRGHKSSYSCSVCCVPLCIRTHTGLRKSCWGMWHSAKVVTLRSTPPSLVFNGRGEGSTATKQKRKDSSVRKNDGGEDAGDSVLEMSGNGQANVERIADRVAKRRRVNA